MRRRDITKRAIVASLKFAVICGVLACLAVSFVWIRGTLAGSEKESTPSVTDSERFKSYLIKSLETKDPELIQSQIRDLYADATYGEQHMSVHYFGEVL